MALRPNYSLVGQGLRLGFVVFIVIHVLISAWLVIDFEGEYTDGAPAPTRIDAIAVIDDEETLIDVKMEKSTSFILYMLYRDYDSSYGVNETADADNSTVVPSEQQNDDKGVSSSSNDSDTDWLKIGRNTTFAFMILLVASEILMFFTLKFRSAIRFFCWFGLILCFTVVMPTTYIIDLVGADEKEDDDCEDLEEWKAEDDADYKSRKKKKRNRAISHNASKHGDTFVPGHDELQQLAKGITEDIVNTDNVSVDIAALRSVVASELSKAFANIQKQSGGCDFNDLIKATRMWAMAQKAKAPDK